MSHVEKDKIKINLVNGNEHTDKNVLKDCYFYPNPTQDEVYDFYLEKGSTPLATGISSGGAFTFSLGNFSWVIPNPLDHRKNPLKITGKGSDAKASGSWLNNDTSKVSIRVKKPFAGDDVTGESGTFQAAAGSGGAVEEETASSAKA